MTKTQLKRILRESVMDPNKLGPSKLIFGAADAKYYELRALELVVEAQSAKCTIREYHDKMRTAITYLAIARAKRENTETYSITTKRK